jgi:hypothetical protein
MHAAHQSPYNLRNGMANGNFNIKPTDIRILAADVGGSFGMKSGVQAEYALVAWAARKAGRPVRWISERTEGHLTDEQAREMRITVELGLDADHKFTALKLRWDANLGAYVTGAPAAGQQYRRRRAIPYPGDAAGRSAFTARAHSWRIAAGRPGRPTRSAHHRYRRARVGISPCELRGSASCPRPGRCPLDRAHLHLRLRRVQGNAGTAAARRTRRLRGAALRMPSAGKMRGAHRPVQLHRGRRRTVPAASERPIDTASGGGQHAGAALG